MGCHRCTMTCIHHYSITQSSFSALKILVFCSFLPLNQPMASTDNLTLSIVLPFPKCNIVGIMCKYIALSDWLLSLSHMHLISSVFSVAELYAIAGLYQFIYSPTCCFPVLAIINKTAKNMCVQVLGWT